MRKHARAGVLSDPTRSRPMAATRLLALVLSPILASALGAQEAKPVPKVPSPILNSEWSGPIAAGPKAQKTLGAAIDAVESMARVATQAEAMPFLTLVEQRLVETRAHVAKQTGNTHKVVHRPKWLGVGIRL